jgi:hypothetical protein
MQAANLVIEIHNGEVVSVTSTQHDIDYVVVYQDTRNNNLSPTRVDLCLKPEDMVKFVTDLNSAVPEKPQEHIKSFLCFGDDSVESRFLLPDGETITVQLPGEAMKGRTLHEKYVMMMAKIDKYRICSQREMDNATN